MKSSFWFHSFLNHHFLDAIKISIFSFQKNVGTCVCFIGHKNSLLGEGFFGKKCIVGKTEGKKSLHVFKLNSFCGPRHDSLIYIKLWLRAFLSLHTLGKLHQLSDDNALSQIHDWQKRRCRTNLHWVTLVSWLSYFRLPLCPSQAESRRPELLRVDVHDGHSGLLQLGGHAHSHLQQALLHHGQLSPAARQVQQMPQRSQSCKGGSDVTLWHDATKTIAHRWNIWQFNFILRAIFLL